MDEFYYKNDELWVEGLPVKEIVNACQTPCFIYSHASIVRAFQAFDTPCHHPHMICYAVKANSNLAILNSLSELGAGFDIVSLGELKRVVAAKGSPQKVVFSGVGKQAHEIKAALEHNIFCFNVESSAELALIQQIASHLNVKAPIALRVNPDVDPLSHPYISTGQKESKFGIDSNEAIALYEHAATLSHIHIKGIACHIGSQLTTMGPFIEACKRLLDLVAQLESKNITLTHIDVGGGLGVRYHQESPPSPQDYIDALLQLPIPKHLKLILEPGRALVANAGILATQVLLIKKSGNKHFCIVDAAMNDYIRPTLYEAWQNIIPLQQNSHESLVNYDIVGPVCESGDFLAKGRPLRLSQGNYLALCQTGAYGAVMSSNYNSRPRAPEILVKANRFHIIRSRETIEELLAKEMLC